jgi:1-deoxyxylulose-5-phosphate synthase
MEYVKLGRSGLKVSRLCLGCMTYGVPDRGNHEWTLPEEESRPFIKRALELGITFFDTSNSYSDGTSEEILGSALKEYAKRDEVVISTKVFFPMRKDPAAKGLSRKNILAEIDHSLRRLSTDFVDLYQIHRYDYDTPLEETLEAVHDVVKASKARLHRGPPCSRGKYARPSSSSCGVARERGVPTAEAALAWVLQKLGVTAPNVGASKPHHLDNAVAALSLKLTDDEVRSRPCQTQQPAFHDGRCFPRAGRISGIFSTTCPMRSDSVMYLWAPSKTTSFLNSRPWNLLDAKMRILRRTARVALPSRLTRLAGITVRPCPPQRLAGATTAALRQTAAREEGNVQASTELLPDPRFGSTGCSATSSPTRPSTHPRASRARADQPLGVSLDRVSSPSCRFKSSAIESHTSRQSFSMIGSVSL